MKQSEIGATRVAQNGYQYIRTEQGWKLTHHVIASRQLGRPLNEDERVGFIDGDRRNLAADNIQVTTKKQGTSPARTSPTQKGYEVTIHLRRCNKCEVEKHFSEFYYQKRDPNQPGNRQNVCKACRIEYLSSITSDK